jgi:hypothetical protein
MQIDNQKSGQRNHLGSGVAIKEGGFFGETTYLLLAFTSIDDPTFLEREFTIQDQTPTDSILEQVQLKRRLSHCFDSGSLSPDSL